MPVVVLSAATLWVLLLSTGGRGWGHDATFGEHRPVASVEAQVGRASGAGWAGSLRGNNETAGSSRSAALPPHSDGMQHRPDGLVVQSLPSYVKPGTHSSNPTAPPPEESVTAPSPSPVPERSPQPDPGTVVGSSAHAVVDTGTPPMPDSSPSSEPSLGTEPTDSEGSVEADGSSSDADDNVNAEVKGPVSLKELRQLLSGSTTEKATFATLRHAATGRQPRKLTAEQAAALRRWRRIHNRVLEGEADVPRALQWSCEGPKVCGGLGDRLLVGECARC